MFITSPAPFRLVSLSSTALDPLVAAEVAYNLNSYLAACQELRTAPVGRFLRGADRERLQLNHRYLGPRAARALAVALTVSQKEPSDLAPLTLIKVAI